MPRLDLKIVDSDGINRAQLLQRELTPEQQADENALDDAARFFMQSYRGMRFTIGFVAFALPWLLIIVDRWLITSQPQIRGSLSAYYHSSARDIFVGGLVATGGFMLSYMIGKRRTYDYWLSSCAGVLVILVALSPTGRSFPKEQNFKVTGTSCAGTPGPPYCNGVQNYFGEDTARTVHQLCASGFVALLAALCIVFALREFGYGPSAAQLCGRNRNVKAVWKAVKARHVSPWTYLLKGIPATGHTPHPAPRHRTLLYLAMTLTIVAAVFWKFIGVALTVPGTSYHLGTNYMTEFVSFNAFGIAWMASSKDLKVFHRIGKRLRRMTSKAAGIKQQTT